MSLSKNDLNGRLAEIFGESAPVVFDSKIRRFGKNKEHWIFGKSWIFNSKEYWVVIYGSWSLKSGIEKGRFTSWNEEGLSYNEKNSTTKRMNRIYRDIQRGIGS